MDLVKSTSWGWEVKKNISWISSSRLLQDEKTRRKHPESHQVDFFRTRRQEEKIMNLVKSTSSGREDNILNRVKSTWWGWEDKKTKSWILSSRIIQDVLTRRRDTWSSQVDFIGREDKEISRRAGTLWVLEGHFVWDSRRGSEATERGEDIIMWSHGRDYSKFRV